MSSKVVPVLPKGALQAAQAASVEEIKVGRGNDGTVLASSSVESVLTKPGPSKDISLVVKLKSNAAGLKKRRVFGTTGFATVGNQSRYAKREARMKMAEHKAWRERLNFIDWCLSTSSGQGFALLLMALFLVMSGSVFVYGLSLEYDMPFVPCMREDGCDLTFLNAMWVSWGFFVDPGTHTGITIEDNIAIQTVGVIFSLLGFCYFLTILGIVVDAIRSQMIKWDDERSKIVENGHMLLLGWTDKTLFIINEYALASETRGGGVVVILGEREKSDMDAEVGFHFSKKALRGTKVHCWTGSPTKVTDLMRVSVRSARTIVVLANSPDVRVADQFVLRVVLSVQSLGSQVTGECIAEVSSYDSQVIVEHVGGEAVEAIVARDMVMRLLCIFALNSRMGNVLSNILGFAGEDFYIKHWPQLENRTFREASDMFDGGVLVGIRHKNAGVHINPPGDMVFQKGDECLVLAADHDSYEVQDFFGRLVEATMELVHDGVEDVGEGVAYMAKATAGVAMATAGAAVGAARATASAVHDVGQGVVQYMSSPPASARQQVSPPPSAAQHATPSPSSARGAEASPGHSLRGQPAMEASETEGRLPFQSAAAPLPTEDFTLHSQRGGGGGSARGLGISGPMSILNRAKSSRGGSREDEDVVRVGPTAEVIHVLSSRYVDGAAMPVQQVYGRQVVCVLGWPGSHIGAQMADMLLLWDSMLMPGSEVHVLCEKPVEDRIAAVTANGANPADLESIKMVHRVGSPTSRNDLEHMPLNEADSIVIVSDTEAAEDVQVNKDEAARSNISMTMDSLCLTALLVTTDIRKTAEVTKTCSIICEVRDPRTTTIVRENKELRHLARFFITRELETKVFAMTADNLFITDVARELLRQEAESNEIMLVDLMPELLDGTAHLTFREISHLLAKGFGHLLLGYYSSAEDRPRLNPSKDEVLRFVPEDKLIIIARRTGQGVESSAFHGSRK